MEILRPKLHNFFPHGARGCLGDGKEDTHERDEHELGDFLRPFKCVALRRRHSCFDSFRLANRFALLIDQSLDLCKLRSFAIDYLLPRLGMPRVGHVKVGGATGSRGVGRFCLLRGRVDNRSRVLRTPGRAQTILFTFLLLFVVVCFLDIHHRWWFRWHLRDDDVDPERLQILLHRVPLFAHAMSRIRLQLGVLATIKDHLPSFTVRRHRLSKRFLGLLRPFHHLGWRRLLLLRRGFVVRRHRHMLHGSSPLFIDLLQLALIDEESTMFGF